METQLPKTKASKFKTQASSLTKTKASKSYLLTKMTKTLFSSQKEMYLRVPRPLRMAKRALTKGLMSLQA